MIPPGDGLDWFQGGRAVRHIVLTNRHHDRDSEKFGVAPVLVPESGLHEYDAKDLEVRGYAPGEEVVPGIVCHEVGSICPDDMALEIRSDGARTSAMAMGVFRELSTAASAIAASGSIRTARWTVHCRFGGSRVETRSAYR